MTQLVTFVPTGRSVVGKYLCGKSDSVDTHLHGENWAVFKLIENMEDHQKKCKNCEKGVKDPSTAYFEKEVMDLFVDHLVNHLLDGLQKMAEKTQAKES